ncbi:MAG TPA: hypothetical protein VL098_03670 [Flavipsychrobacter sp.]|nr:hypothetical protein [Flavipsychrobacter sp.]
MSKTLESRIKKLDKMLRASLIKQSLYDEVFEHILSSLNFIKMANKTIEQRLEEQGKTLEKILAEQTAARELYNEQKPISLELREELDCRNANDGAVARLLDRSDELVKQIDDLYVDAPPATGSETPVGEQHGTGGDQPLGTEQPGSIYAGNNGDSGTGSSNTDNSAIGVTKQERLIIGKQESK